MLESDIAREDRRWAFIYWCCQLLGWGTYCALGLAMTLRAAGPSVPLFVGYGAFLAYVLPITHLLGRTIRRREWLGLSPGAAVGRLLLAALLTSALLVALILAVQVVTTLSFAPLRQLSGLFALGLSITMATLLWTAIFSSIVALFRARHARRRSIALELGMREARLKALEAQIGPHFLFNSLNSLRGMIAEDPVVAQDMVTRLANILRHNLARDSSPTESFGQQVEFTTDYLALESVRFEERLRTRFEIQPETRACAAPAMLLQTLVENAIKHGIAHLPAGGEVVVRSRLEDGILVVEVENTGRLSPPSSGSTRIGLANLRERLRVLHGAGATLDLIDTPRGTVVATVRMPPGRPDDPAPKRD